MVASRALDTYEGETMRVRAAFFVTVEAEVEDYGKFVSPHFASPSVEQAQSWLSQNYFARIDSGIEVGDRPESLTWTVDTVVEPIVDEVEALVSKHWALSDHIYGDDGFKEFVRQQEREEALREIGRIGQEQDAAQQARGYRDFL